MIHNGTFEWDDLSSLGPWLDPVPPSGWGEDRLSCALIAAHANAQAFFQFLPAEYGRLAAINGELRVLSMISTPILSHPREAQLALRTSVQYQSAAHDLMEFRIYESSRSVRATIECAGYTLLLMSEPGVSAAWHKRHQGRIERKAAQQAMKAAAVRAAVRLYCGRVADNFDEVYESSIDLGAHPNLEGLQRTSTARSRQGGIALGSQPFTNRIEEIRRQCCLVEKAGVVSAELLDVALSGYRNGPSQSTLVTEYLARSGIFAEH